MLTTCKAVEEGRCTRLIWEGTPQGQEAATTGMSIVLGTWARAHFRISPTQWQGGWPLSPHFPRALAEGCWAAGHSHLELRPVLAWEALSRDGSRKLGNRQLRSAAQE